MSARVLHATRLVTRQRRQIVLAGCLGLAAGTGVAIRSSPRVRFDASPPAHFSTSPGFSSSDRDRRKEKKETLDPDLMRQLSGGSVTGFLSGLLVSVFSRTLVLLLGVSVVIVQVRFLFHVFSQCGTGSWIAD